MNSIGLDSSCWLKMSGYGSKIFMNMDHINLFFEDPVGSSLKKKNKERKKPASKSFSSYISSYYKMHGENYLGGGPVIRIWNQEVCSLCDLRFEPCGCSYDSHWRLTWSLIPGSVGLVEVHAS
jgi:hypothetical protein